MANGSCCCPAFAGTTGFFFARVRRMNRTQQTAVAAGALTVGTALLARRLRALRTMDFRGRSVVITGGSRGLGLQIARALGEEGARLTIGARDQDELDRARDDLASRGVDVDVVRCDVTRRDEAERLIKAAVARTRSGRGMAVRAASALARCAIQRPFPDRPACPPPRPWRAESIS